MKKIFSFAAAAILMLSLFPAAYADTDDMSLVGKTWEEIIDDFISDSTIDPDRISLGYFNTVTGEEHYYNPDKYMMAASTYKVPLNMYYTEQISLGSMAWDDLVGGAKYSDMLKSTIVDSNNDRAAILWECIGSYGLFRKTICPYLGEDPDAVDYRFLTENVITARQMTSCIRLLYENPERFPRIIDYMSEAQPNGYFNYEQHPFPVAHKYGFFRDDGGGHILNDCGIVYTDEPIVIVMYTSGFATYKNLSDYCALMIDYTQYHTELRQAQVEDFIQMKSSLFSQLTNINPVCISTSDTVRASGLSFSSLLVTAAVIVFMIAAIALVISARQKGRRIKPLWAILSALFCAAAMLVCIVGSQAGTVYAKPSGDPQETVCRFFDSLIAGDYEQAYSCLSGYSSLGLENIPETGDGRLIYDALRRSYSYELHGSCAVEKLSAHQQVNLQYLDLASLERDVQTAVNPVLSDMVKNRSRSELYDSHNKYLPSVTDEAYSTALAQVLSHAGDYYSTAGLELELTYSSGQWLIVAGQPMLKALLGGVSQ